jgi:hypothetical protein
LHSKALADVAKGNETVEYACSLPQLAQGRILRVSSDVTCQDRRDPLGVVASIVPFNFPFMVRVAESSLMDENDSLIHTKLKRKHFENPGSHVDFTHCLGGRKHYCIETI